MRFHVKVKGVWKCSYCKEVDAKYIKIVVHEKTCRFKKRLER